MLSVLISFAVIFGLSLAVESVVEAVLGEPFNHMPKILPYKWLLKYVAFAVGIGGAILYKFDFISLLSTWFSTLIPEAPPMSLPVTYYGMILTGCTIGRGSQAVHDLYQKWAKPVTPKEQL